MLRLNAISRSLLSFFIFFLIRAYSLTKFILLLLLCFIITGCATPSLPLSKFIDNLQYEIAKTSEINRLTVAQVASGEGDVLIKKEQKIQGTSDPILLFLDGGIKFTLDAQISGQTTSPKIDVTSFQTALPSVPKIMITSSKRHKLDYTAKPISLSNLPNIVFQGDI